ncbi:MAG: hypothetical protein AB7L36_12125 [Sphingomonadaceae bacterium]
MALLLVGLAHERENPVSAIEWVDHYGYCLNTNFQQVVEANKSTDRSNAASRALVRCWPVRASAEKVIMADLKQSGRQRDICEQERMTERLFTTTVHAFAAQNGIRYSTLGPQTAPSHGTSQC